MREDSEEVIISRIWDNHGKEVGYEQKGVLVRCKDCKYNNAETENTDDSKPTCKAVCNLMIYVHNADDYCSYGERKEQEHECDKAQQGHK